MERGAAASHCRAVACEIAPAAGRYPEVRHGSVADAAKRATAALDAAGATTLIDERDRAIRRHMCNARDVSDAAGAAEQPGSAVPSVTLQLLITTLS